MRAGESEHALHLCARLAAAGHHVDIVTSVGCSAPPGAALHVWPIMRRWDWRELPRLLRAVRGRRPDAVLLMYSGWIYQNHPMITFLPAIVRRIMPAVVFVTQFETDDGKAEWTWGAAIVRKVVKVVVRARSVDYVFGTLLRDSHRLVFLSEHHWRHFTALDPVAANTGTLIPPPPLLRVSPADPEARARTRRELGVAENDFLFAFFGYVDPNKGIETLFAALVILRRSRPGVRLVMVGGGRGTARAATTALGEQVTRYEARLQATPTSSGIDDTVIWIPGYLPDTDAGSRYLRAADAAILPFDSGVTLNRSSVAACAAHALPIVTTRGSMLERAFETPDAVLLCAPKSAEVLAAALMRLVDDRPLRERLALGSSRLADEWFSWERAVEQTEAALRDEAPPTYGPEGQSARIL